MKKFFLLFSLLASISIYAQNEGTVKGNVLDMEMGGEPLLFALVEIDGTDRSTETNFNGNFELDHIPPGKYTLKISSLGYDTVSLPIEITKNEVLLIQEELHAKQMGLQDVQTVTSGKKTAFAGK